MGGRFGKYGDSKRMALIRKNRSYKKGDPRNKGVVRPFQERSRKRNHRLPDGEFPEPQND
ncbi:MAG: hypothetical protein A2V65_05120 [Deltaproteobacteria bacterium RBG_13_49_15]|nr:MAG: hypothetical protein A2V65_05120 [Deltaproteobacteria bacterium RBG_13_49_15]